MYRTLVLAYVFENRLIISLNTSRNRVQELLSVSENSKCGIYNGCLNAIGDGAL